MTRRRDVLVRALRLAAAAGLAVDSYVHADLAGSYDANTAGISEGDLFRIEAALSACAAVGVVLLRRRPGAVVAAIVAAAVGGAGLAAVLVLRYVPIGTFGPFPDMYEPVWYPEKAVSAVAEGVAAVSALALIAAARWSRHPAITERQGEAVAEVEALHYHP